jgi:hypothetical protein
VLLEAGLHILQGLVSLQLGELPNAENELKVKRTSFYGQKTTTKTGAWYQPSNEKDNLH